MNTLPEIDPNQLIKALESELALKRAARHRPDDRNSFRVWSLVMIVAGSIIALTALQYLLSQMRPVPPEQPPSHAELSR